jgi:hypothetical protein
MTFHGTDETSLTSPRDQRLLHREAEATQRERFGEGVAGPRVYSRLELVDLLRWIVHCHRTEMPTISAICSQAADELERYDREVFAGRTQ